MADPQSGFTLYFEVGSRQEKDEWWSCAPVLGAIAHGSDKASSITNVISLVYETCEVYCQENRQLPIKTDVEELLSDWPEREFRQIHYEKSCAANSPSSFQHESQYDSSSDSTSSS